MACKRSRWLLRSSAVGVQVSRCFNSLAEQSQHRVGVLPARVLSSVRNAFAHIHTFDSAALTRLCGRCTRIVQGDFPQCRHEGPHNFDLVLDTSLRCVIVNAWQHSVQVSMKVRFTPRPACTCSPLNISLRSTRCSMAPRRRRAPSPRPRAASRAALRRVAARFSTTQCSSRCRCCCCRSLLGGLDLQGGAQGGAQGGCGGAGALRLRAGGLGGLPVRVRRVRRRHFRRECRHDGPCSCSKNGE